MRILLWTQAIYILTTAIWALVSIDTFMAVTGEKTDVWLVKTVGALLIPVGVCLVLHLFISTDHRTAAVLGCLTALAFICIDFYYALSDVISDIYLVDGAIQILFFLAWIVVVTSKKYR